MRCDPDCRFADQRIFINAEKTRLAFADPNLFIPPE
jgi:hypothetical protein